MDWLRRYWFMVGLVGVCVVTLMDSSGMTAAAGRWLKAHHGPDIAIVLIFFLSGLALDTASVRSGLADWRATLTALVLILLLAPVVAAGLSVLPLAAGVVIGLFLVAAMPTTLSSGVVMSGAAGGNMAHALVVTIVASAVAVVTIPYTLSVLLPLVGAERIVVIDKSAIMVKIALVVLLPLIAGLWAKSVADRLVSVLGPLVGWINQSFILIIVWMALSEGRETLVAGAGDLLPIIGLVSGFHLILVALGFGAAGLARLAKGRRESVILMGGQKTLPLSVMLQVSLFPEHAVALVVCVVHHIVHLIMDSYLVQRLKKMD